MMLSVHLARRKTDTHACTYLIFFFSFFNPASRRDRIAGVCRSVLAARMLLGWQKGMALTFGELQAAAQVVPLDSFLLPT